MQQQFKQFENRLTFADAAERVLQEYAKDKKPMHFTEITKRAIDKGWIKTGGETPEATMNAWIGNLDNKKRMAKGKKERFFSTGKGYYGLTAWRSNKKETETERNNEKVGIELLKEIKELSPVNFEKVIAKLLAHMGFENIEMTKRSGDGGIDVYGKMIMDGIVEINAKVQAKRWKGTVPPKIIRELRGVLNQGEYGFVVTTSSFSKKAIEEATDRYKLPVILINNERLIELMFQYDLGIIRDKKTERVFLNKKWFSEIRKI